MTGDLLAATLLQIRPADGAAMAAARERQARLTKPPGALGMLEELSVQLAGLAGVCPPPVPAPAAVAIFAGDHGVYAQGVTPWPQEVTLQMVGNFLAGGAAVNAFAGQVGVAVVVVDVGVAGTLDAAQGLLIRKVVAGTRDMTAEAAMTSEEAVRAIEVGIEVAQELVAAGHGCLLTGDMGIANTTASAALIAAFTGRDPAEVTGRGTGIDDDTLARKTAVVRPRSRCTPRTRPTRCPCSPRSVASSTRRSPGSCWGPPPHAYRWFWTASPPEPRRSPQRPSPRPAWQAAWPATCPPSRATPSRSLRWGCARWSTSGCGSAKAPAPCWRSRWCRPALPRSLRWLPSTAPGSRTRADASTTAISRSRDRLWNCASSARSAGTTSTARSSAPVVNAVSGMVTGTPAARSGDG